MDEYLKRIEVLEAEVRGLKAVIKVQLNINQRLKGHIESLAESVVTVSETSVEQSKIIESLIELLGIKESS